MDIKELYEKDYIGEKITVQGWVKNHRKQAHFGFIDLFDGTTFKTLQVVYDDTLENFEEITKIKLGSAVTVSGTLIKSPKELLEAIPKAFAIASSGRPGTVLIDIPVDIQKQKITFELNRNNLFTYSMFQRLLHTLNKSAYTADFLFRICLLYHVHDKFTNKILKKF